MRERGHSARHVCHVGRTGSAHAWAKTAHAEIARRRQQRSRSKIAGGSAQYTGRLPKTRLSTNALTLSLPSRTEKHPHVPG